MEPMLARLVHELPVGDCLLYEPKWDGFRCLASRNGASVDLRSRNRRPLGRYFPEITEALLELPADSFLSTASSLSGADFVALLERLHPAASLVERRRHETPASLMAFDLLTRKLPLPRPVTSASALWTASARPSKGLGACAAPCRCCFGGRFLPLLGGGSVVRRDESPIGTRSGCPCR